MKHVRLSLTAGGQEGEIHPVYDLLANSEQVRYATAINWNFTGETLGILHYIEGEQGPVGAALREIPQVREYEIATVDADTFFVYILDETTPPMRELFGVLMDSGLVMAPPIEFHESGTVTFSLSGPSDRLQRALERIPAPVDVTIEEISGLGMLPQTAPAALTTRQREAIETAVSLGYYERPREADVDQIADTLECSASTAAEHLRKAEAAILHRLFARS